MHEDSKHPTDAGSTHPREHGKHRFNRSHLSTLSTLGSLISLIPLALITACGSEDTELQHPPPSAEAGTDGAGDARNEEADQDVGVQDGPSDTEVGDATEDVIDPKIEVIRQAIETERTKLGVPGVAVAILEGGKVTFASGFGSKDPEGDDPVLASTLFRIGSVNKVLTAMALLQLVDSGDIDLQEPITTYLPSLTFKKDATWAPSIRVKHLITHESAIVDFIEIDSSSTSDSQLSTVMLGPAAEIIYLMAPAGRMYNYSNPGYMYAGLVAEVVSGRWYRTLMDERVFTPLGMDRTFFLPSEVIADGDYALGKTLHWETSEALVVHPETYENVWARPAGYGWSSVLDLAQLVMFLRDGNEAVMSDSLREEMMSPQVDTKEFLDRKGYGYGLFVQQGAFLNDFYDIKIVQHGGSLPGFTAGLTYVPTCDLGFITLASADAAHFSNSLVTAIKTLCSLPAPSTPPDLTVDSSTFDALVGTYEDPYNVGTVFVTEEGNQLKVEMPLLDSLQIPYESLLIPSVPDNFLMTVQGVPFPITFLRDDQGKAEYLRSRFFVGVRVEMDGGAPIWLQANPPDPKVWLKRLREPVWSSSFLPTHPAPAR